MIVIGTSKTETTNSINTELVTYKGKNNDWTSTPVLKTM